MRQQPSLPLNWFHTKNALTLAEFLSARKSTRAVGIFGRVAREGEGADIDVILFVDDKVASEFLQTAPASSLEYEAGRDRRRIAQKLLGYTIPDSLVNYLPGIGGKPPIDVFLLPASYYQDNGKEWKYPEKVTEFLANIHQDILMYVPDCCEFIPYAEWEQSHAA